MIVPPLKKFLKALNSQRIFTAKKHLSTIPQQTKHSDVGKKHQFFGDCHFECLPEFQSREDASFTNKKVS